MKGIIFDVDGTMVDNMMIHHKAWQEQLASLGLEMSIDEVKEQIHGVNLEILERLFGNRFTHNQRIEIANQKEATYRKIFLPELKLIKGLKSFLDLAKDQNIPMSVASAGPPANVNFIIQNLKLESYFKGIYHSDSVSKGKPDPEVFLKAAAAMGISPTDCLVFEDSITGAEAAKRAGSKAIIVTSTHAESEFSQFDHIQKFITDFTSLDLKDLGF